MKKGFLVLLVCFFASSLTVSANQELVKLESNHIYTKYDINGDGNADLFEYKRDGSSQAPTFPVNLNNEQFDLEILSNSILYFFSSNEEPFLFSTGYSGGAGSWVEVFRFKEGEFEQLDAFNTGFTLTWLDRVDDEYIYLECQEKHPDSATFKYSAPLSCYVLYEYNPESETFDLVTDYAEMKGQPEYEYIGNVPMVTSTSAEDWNQDGPIVNRGDIVKLLDFYLPDRTEKKYRIEVNGEKCWFQEAEEYVLDELPEPQIVE